MATVNKNRRNSGRGATFLLTLLLLLYCVPGVPGGWADRIAAASGPSETAAGEPREESGGAETEARGNAETGGDQSAPGATDPADQAQTQAGAGEDSMAAGRQDDGARIIISAQSRRNETLKALKALNVPTMDMGNLEVPLFSPARFATCSLLNLLLALLCLTAGFLSGLILWTDRIDRAAPARDGQRARGTPMLKIALMALGFSMALLFLMTEDVTNLMVLTNSFTPLMTILTLVQAYLLREAFGRRAG
jgi:hypothetical protein